MAKILPIVKHPNAVLRRKAKAVHLKLLANPAIQTLIDDMAATMWEADGVGIAAPQIGESVRIVIITSGREAVPLINPRILYRSLRRETLEEGCLSVPGFYGSVKRAWSIHVTAYTRAGKKIKFKAEGLPARIVQHEIDHINGILYIDRADTVIPLELAAA